jgi:hypothetical protein
MKRRNEKRRSLPVRQQPKLRLVQPVPRKMPPQYRAR